MSTSRVIGRFFASTTALAAGVGALLPSSAAPYEVADAPVSVIVAATTSAAGRAAVERLGGQVTHDLPFIDSVAATVPSAALSQLEQTPGVLGVAPDEKVHVQGSFSAASPAELPPSVYRQAIRSDELESDGTGITVALLDTGITMSPDLEGRIKFVKSERDGALGPCINLSGTDSCDDDYGHGTFMAGLIAGTGASSETYYAGVAPGAQVVSIKVASDDGSADVSNVLAGIQWAVSFRKKYEIKVLNLSLGTDSQVSWRIDPLNMAVERAWNAGITVVVAASNRGPQSGTISKPGDDPYVITVGADDDQGTAPIDDDVVPDFSSRGPAPYGVDKPDVVAPGASLVSLNAPGSLISDTFHDAADGAYLVGSGTSMATAVVSGVVAQILSANTTFKPNRVKYVLRATARPVAGAPKEVVGKGMVDALEAGYMPPPGLANQGLNVRLPLGSIIGSRGATLVEFDDGTILDDVLTAQGVKFRVPRFLETWRPGTWWGSQWVDNDWNHTSWWEGDNWEGDNWEGCFVGGGPGDECDYGSGEVSGSKWYGAWG